MPQGDDKDYTVTPLPARLEGSELPGARVKVECVSKSYGPVKALECAGLEALPGMVTVIAGPSGSGKTTLLRIIGGFEEPSSGRVYYDGQDVTGSPPWERRAVMLSQRPVLLPHLTVQDNIVLAAEAAGLQGREAVEEAVRVARMLGVEGVLERRPGELSGGQLQRASLAALLAARPRVLLLDEPFAHLDQPLRERLRRVVAGLARESGVTIVKVTHDQDEALEVADRLVILIGGRVVDEGPVERVYMEPGDPGAAVFLGHNAVCLEGSLATFPMEAVSPGGSWLRGRVVEVARRRGYSVVTVETGLGRVRYVERGAPPGLGVEVGLGVDEGLLRVWEASCSGLAEVVVAGGEEVDA